MPARRGSTSCRTCCNAGAYPSRAVADNLADITAQVAANHQGVRDLHRLVERYSLPVTLAYMRHIQDAAERKMRGCAGPPAGWSPRFVDHLDDGTPIAVAITISRRSGGRRFHRHRARCWRAI